MFFKINFPNFYKFYKINIQISTICLYTLINNNLLTAYPIKTFLDTNSCVDFYTNKLTPSNNVETFADLLSLAHRNTLYQDIVVHGETIYHSVNHKYCSHRYNLIKTMITECIDNKMLKNKFSILDIGAAQGYFSFKLAHDFDSSCTLLENGHSALKGSDSALELLEKLSLANQPLDSSIQKADLSDPKTLSNLYKNNNKFDVVLALCIAHFFDNWQEFIDNTLRLGTFVFIEVPLSTFGDTTDLGHRNELPNIHKYLHTHAYKSVILSRYYKNQKSVLYLFKN